MHGVSFDVAKAEVVALVGESGSGKTTISRCVGGLHKQWTGEVTFEGRAAGQGLAGAQRRGPQADPVHLPEPVPVAEPAADHRSRSCPGRWSCSASPRASAARDRVVELLDAVALGPTVLNLQTNRLSGGERQRVAIARALAAEPDLLVCDEITSALDVSVQGSIVALLENLRKTRRISMLFVTHNLALVRSIAARVQVLNAGELVESGFVVEVLDTPQAGLHQAAARATRPRWTDGPKPASLSTHAFVNPQLAAGAGWTTSRCRPRDPRPLPVAERPLAAGHGRRRRRPGDEPGRVPRRRPRARRCSCWSTGAAARVVPRRARPRGRCSSAPRRPSRCCPPGRRGGPLWRAGAGRPGRAARARAGRHRLRAGAGAPPAHA